ncbi:MAG: alpha-mannosidase [Promethearchaeota archaeon]
MNGILKERSVVGHYSGNRRDFDLEYANVEEQADPDDARTWIEKAGDPAVQAEFGRRYRERWAAAAPDAGVVHFVGNSHVDVAWKWRYLQTCEKAKVTFEKACVHVEEVDEYTFSGSQPVLFDWIRVRHPALFERIRAAVGTGRFELVGGCWVEPDGHMPSAEAWARQRLHGQLFYRKYFGRIATVGWLPDTFGFATQLPQLLAKSGATAFYTHKLASNEVNRFPFTTFWWRAPDGTKVLALSQGGASNRLLRADAAGNAPTFTYSHARPEEHEGFSDERVRVATFLYGKGDGGHGPTGEEVQEKLHVVRRDTRFKLTGAGEFFEEVRRRYADRLPTWGDELYYELHRGTLTTQALVKRQNRLQEWALPALEALCLLASANAGHPFPGALLRELWRVTLLNQFHDVLPGSSIPEVYDDCWDFWVWQLEREGEVAGSAAAALAQSAATEPPAGARAPWEDQCGHLVVPVLHFNPTCHAADRLTLEIPAPAWSGVGVVEVRDASGRPVPHVLLPAVEAEEPLYSLPSRLAVNGSVEPFGLTTWYLVGYPGDPEVDGGEPVKLADLRVDVDRPVRSERLEGSLRVETPSFAAAWDRETGALTSLRVKVGGGWRETLLQGPKRFSPRAPELVPGVAVHAFRDAASVEPAWNLHRKFRETAHPRRVRHVRFISRESTHAAVEVVTEHVTPNPERRGEEDVTRVTARWDAFHDDPLLHLTLRVAMRSRRVLLKLDVPTATGAPEVEVEVAAHVDRRPTVPKNERDAERWENVMHRWVNVQAPGDEWGLAVLNQGKYAVDYRGGYLGVSLLRGQAYPPAWPEAWVYEERFRRMDEGGGFPPSWTDQGDHVFRLALYPHPGTAEETAVHARAALFNSPQFFWSNGPSEQPVAYSSGALRRRLPRVDPPVELLAVKLAHPDGDGGGFFSAGAGQGGVLVARGVNLSERPVESPLVLGGTGVVAAVECDLLERPLPGARPAMRPVRLPVRWKPFEVKTWALLLDSPLPLR